MPSAFDPLALVDALWGPPKTIASQGAGLEGPSPIVAAGSPVSKQAPAASSPAMIDVLLQRMDGVREGISALSRHFFHAG